MVLKTLHRIAIVITSTLLPGMVIERCIATSYYKIYERSFNGCFSQLFCIIQTFISASIIIIGTIFFPNTIEKSNYISICQYEFLSYDFTIYITYIILSSAVISIISFIILLYINKHLYNKAITNFSNGYLTRKFQLSENIKICRLMCQFIMIYFFGIVICSIFLITASRISINSMTYKNYVTIIHCFGQGVDISLASISSCLCLYAMSKFKKSQFKIGFKDHKKNSKVSPLTIKGISGNNLILDIEVEKKLYFKELNKQWY
ncbi:7TM GPCR, serpentine receptor class e (Sre) family-containing protein [Strongyloides ratti]|uniref:7TM GPCR, serpentine receptor class e (Sre) family-containing protein n=1 Tax=Strongyloides ratti TaxID=34506 RepID=A0A090L0G2_STRRB|nr:7TM GPCR, serpentine receptor class e (Sre) family-containing protein [Strongyloides ratti]CEF63235.1 7TM GPCR, serpentine receptor class e (Sre) family-containing protein [Strongyloides ratti]